MRASPSSMQLAAIACSCTIVTALIEHPATLPGPFRVGVERAVDGAARVWLWSWGEPADALDRPAEPWNALGDTGRAGVAHTPHQTAAAVLEGDQASAATGEPSLGLIQTLG